MKNRGFFLPILSLIRQPVVKGKMVYLRDFWQHIPAISDINFIDIRTAISIQSGPYAHIYHEAAY